MLTGRFQITKADCENNQICSKNFPFFFESVH